MTHRPALSTVSAALSSGARKLSHSMSTSTATVIDMNNESFNPLWGLATLTEAATIVNDASGHTPLPADLVWHGDDTTISI